ncbi:MAG: alginate lyase family protein [Planctomycetota bacterium]
MASRIAEHRRVLWPLRAKSVQSEAEGLYTFLNQSIQLHAGGDFNSQDFNWRPKAPRLWLFHLQCMETMLERCDQLSDEYAVAMVESWISEANHRSPNLDVDAWHPFCISRRLPAWLSLEAVLSIPIPANSTFWLSVSAQSRWLSKNCEWDLGGNHLLENLTALYLCSGLLKESHAIEIETIERWLEKELTTQVLSSGEHFERTPTYHTLMMVCVAQCLEVAIFAERQIAKSLTAYLKRMRDFVDWIRQPNGDIPILGDSALDETPDLDHLLAWCDGLCFDATKTSHQSTQDSASPIAKDYWKAETRGGDQLLFDVGEMACDHLPAHGHADLLQVVASFGGQAAIVDTGNAEYKPGDLRSRCRSTSAHNVMQLDSQELCDHWGSFRMGKRGHVVWKSCGRNDAVQWCAAKHDGFNAEAGRVALCLKDVWFVVDWFRGKRDHTATSRMHLHPDFQPEEKQGGWMIRNKDDSSLCRFINVMGTETSHRIEPSIYCPEFGCVLESNVLIASTEPNRQGWIAFGFTANSNQTERVEISEYTSIKLDNNSLSIECGTGWMWRLVLDSNLVRLRS